MTNPASSQPYYEHGRKLDDGQTGAGSVNTVHRRGQTVIRPAGSWSPAVHGLLRHLHTAEFAYAPHIIDTNPTDHTETLTYIEGEVAMRPWPPAFLHLDGITAVARLIKQYHRAVADYVPAADHAWRDPTAAWRPGLIVRHGDLGPWNMVWRDGRLVGLIDWDLAEPGTPAEGVAQAAWYCVPVRPDEECAKAGVDAAGRAARLRAFSAAYGMPVEAILQAQLALQTKELARTEALNRAGVAPWTIFYERGDMAEIRREQAWLRQNFDRLLRETH